MVDLQFSVGGAEPVDAQEELSSWLKGEPELHRRVRQVAAAPMPNEMGAVADVLVVAVGSGGALSVLAASLRTFLAQPRHSDVRISLQGPDGRRVEIDAKRVTDVEGLVRQAIGPEG